MTYVCGGIGVVIGFAHVGIYTLDLDISVDFYSRCLGFRLVWRGIVHHKTGELPVATLQLGSFVIEIVRPAAAEKVRYAEGPIQHLALLVEDIEGCITDLEAKGVGLDEEIDEIGYDGGTRHCFVRGPSNERIELCERIGVH
ncbi:MAG: VOC family protein [Treponemataceae bacterium]